MTKKTVRACMASFLCGVLFAWLSIAYMLDYQKRSPIDYAEAGLPAFLSSQVQGRNATSLSMALNPCLRATSSDGICKVYIEKDIPPPIKITLDKEVAVEEVSRLRSPP